jgi:hypothetical protein
MCVLCTDENRINGCLYKEFNNVTCGENIQVTLRKLIALESKKLGEIFSKLREQKEIFCYKILTCSKQYI